MEHKEKKKKKKKRKSCSKVVPYQVPGSLRRENIIYRSTLSCRCRLQRARETNPSVPVILGEVRGCTRVQACTFQKHSCKRSLRFSNLA